MERAQGRHRTQTKWFDQLDSKHLTSLIPKRWVTDKKKAKKAKSKKAKKAKGKKEKKKGKKAKKKKRKFFFALTLDYTRLYLHYDTGGTPEFWNLLAGWYRIHNQENTVDLSYCVSLGPRLSTHWVSGVRAFMD